MPADNITFLESTRIQTETETYGAWSSGDMYEELLVYVELTEQGAWTDETLNITIQVQNQSKKAFDIASFNEITDQTAAILTDGYYRVSLPVKWFGTKCRIKVVTAGTSVDYTLNIEGHLKRT